MAKEKQKQGLTQELINRLEGNGDKPYNVWDNGGGRGAVSSLFVKVQPTGNKAWYLAYRINGSRSVTQTKIAPGSVPLKKAREIAQEWLGDIAKGLDPKQLRAKEPEEKPEKTLTLETLITDFYEPYLRLYKKESSKHTRWHLNSFREFFSKEVSEITPGMLAEWQSTALQSKSKKTGKPLAPSTVTRRLAALYAMINWAVHLGYIPPLALTIKIEPLKKADNERIRTLEAEEKTRLWKALASEKWKCTYMPLAVTLALYTGIRCGTLRQLKWSDLDLKNKTARLRAEIMKNNRNYTIPLSKKVITELKRWKEKQASDSVFVLSSSPATASKEALTASKIYRDFEILRSDAEISNDFTWHCFRHTFATELIKKNVNLRVVQELMTHRKIDETIRYTHPDPATKAEAVNLLD